MFNLDRTGGEMSDRMPSPNDLLSQVEPVYRAMALLAGMQLRVFTMIAEGAETTEEIADRIGADPARLSRLLHALAAAGHLEVVSGRFRNAPMPDAFLVAGRERYMGGAHELWADLWAATLRTAESVTSGAPAARHNFEEMTGEDLRTMFRSLHGGAVASGRSIASALELSAENHLLDVGGGSGGLAIGACEMVPGLRATIVDLPDVAEIAGEFVAEAGLSARVSIHPANLTTEKMTGEFDVVVLRYLLQVLAGHDAAALLKNLFDAVASGGRVHILGWVLADDRQNPPAAVNFDLVFVNLYDDGAAYTQSEHRDWLEAAGFTDVRFSPAPSGGMPPGTTLVSATKP